jgi:hypothetical protein
MGLRIHLAKTKVMKAYNKSSKTTDIESWRKYNTTSISAAISQLTVILNKTFPPGDSSRRTGLLQTNEYLRVFRFV